MVSRNVCYDDARLRRLRAVAGLLLARALTAGPGVNSHNYA
jgi:hypothetical protein